MKEDDKVMLLPEDDEKVELLPEGDDEQFKEQFMSIGEQALGVSTDIEDEADISAAVASKMGMQKGLTGGWRENLAAAGDTVDDVIEAAATGFMKNGIQGTVDAMPDIKDNFDKNLAAEKQMEAKARQKYPDQFSLGDLIGTGIGEFTVLKGAKGFKALTNQTGFSLVHGLGRTEDETLEGAAADVAIEVGVGTVPVAGQVLRRTRLGSRAVEFIGDRAEKTMVPAFFRFLGGKAEKITDDLTKYGKNKVEWAQRVLNMTNDAGEKVIKKRLPKAALAERVMSERNMASDDMSMILGMIDLKVTDPTKHMNTKVLYSKLNTEVFHDRVGGAFHGVNKQKIAAMQSLQKRVYDSLFDVTQDQFEKEVGQSIPKYIADPNLNFTSLKNFTHDMFSEADSAFRVEAGIARDKLFVQRDVAKLMHKHLDDTIKGVAGPDALDMYVGARTRYGDLATTGEALQRSLSTNKDVDYISSIFKNRLFVAGSIAGTAGLSLHDPVVAGALGTASALGMVASSRRINGVVANGARRIMQAFKSNPDKYGDMAAKLVAASNISGEAFMDEMYLTSAKVDLMEKPLARTTQDVFNRRSQILALVSDIDEETGSNLRKAIDESNTTEIGSIMTQLAQKAPPGMIESGMGWDGVAWDPGTQESVEKSLRKNLTPREQALLIPRFREDKKIPPEYYGKASPNPMNRLAYMKRTNKIDKPVI